MPILVHMTTRDDAAGWKLAYKLLMKEARRQACLTQELLAEKSGLHRSTLDRMRNGERLSSESRDQLEGAVDLPRDLLLYVASGDLEAVREAVADRPDLVRWLTREMGALNT